MTLAPGGTHGASCIGWSLPSACCHHKFVERSYVVPKMKLPVVLFALFACILGATSVNCQEAAEAIDEKVNTADASSAELPESDATEVKEDTAEKEETPSVAEEAPVQRGPFVDLLGETLLSLEMIDETHAQLKQQYTNDALSGKTVVGLYFSADWCNPCRQFTPDLVSFYNKMNAQKGKKDQFEIVWVSRCRDMESFGQYFTHMNWLALPPEEAMGQRGQMLSEKYKVKGIPYLVLLDEVGNVITSDARNKIPQDKAGIGFPWRNPIARVYMTLFPKSLRLMLKTQITSVKDSVMQKLKGGNKKATTA